ncbi:MAG: serine/threonine-protein kinase [Planctomycetales bacterium]
MGGHGIVFLARDPNLDRLIALKVPRPDVLVHESMCERFMAEGRAAAMLHHPNIVTIFEAGQVGAICYLAQDYIPGPSLADWLEEHPQPLKPRAAATFLLELTDGIDAAHRHHLLHRDIKPGNILLAPASFDLPLDRLEHFIPKLTDFGLAKILDTRVLTRSGMLIGTPAYMPPEVLAGNNREAAPVVDLYALGIILYQLLTGTLPFAGEAAAEIFHKISTGQLIPPRQINPDIPRDLETICLKCIDPDPRRRFQTARELAADLQRFLDDRPVLARRISLGERFWRKCRRHPGLLASLCLLAFLTLSGVLFVQSMLSSTHDQYQSLLQKETYFQQVILAHEEIAQGKYAEGEARLDRLIPKPGDRDWRGWEWSLQKTFLPKLSLLRELHAHQAEVHALAISPDARTIFSVDVSGTLCIWDAQTGQLRKQCRPHPSEITSLQITPDGKTLVSAGVDRIVRLLDPQTGAELYRFPPFDLTVSAIAVSEDGQLLAVGTRSNEVSLWNLPQRTLWQKLPPFPDVITSLEFGGPSIVPVLSIGCKNKTTYLFGLRERAIIRQVNDAAPTLCVKNGPNLKQVTRVGYGTRISIDDFLDKDSPPLVIPLRDGRIPCCTFSVDKTYLFTGFANGTISVLRFDNPDTQPPPPFEFRAHQGSIETMALSSDNAILVTAGEDHVVRIWDASPFMINLRGLATRKIRYAAISPDDHTAAFLDADGTVEVRDLDRPASPGVTFKTEHGAHLCKFFDPRTLIVPVRGHVLHLVDPATGESTRRIPLPDDLPDQSFDLVRDVANRLIYVVLWNRRELLQISLQEPAVVRKIIVPAEYGNVRDVVLRPQTEELLIGTTDGLFNYRPSENRFHLLTPATFPLSTRALAAHPNGHLLACAANDGQIVVWDLLKNRLAVQLLSHNSACDITDIRYNADGSRLCAISKHPNGFYIWNAANRNELIRLKFNIHQYLATSPSDRHLLFYDFNGSTPFHFRFDR